MRKMNQMNQMLRARVPTETWGTVKKIAEMLGVTTSDVVREAVNAYITTYIAKILDGGDDGRDDYDLGGA